MRIGIVAPSCRIDKDVVERVSALAKGRAELVWHPQCFESHFHFAGTDWSRRDAFVAMANDPDIDAIWFARGGYGAVRLLASTVGYLGPAAQTKSYMGYSDAGYLLAALYARGIGQVFHGPMPADIRRERGEQAVARALDWLIDRNPAALEPSVGSIPNAHVPLAWIEERERSANPPPTIAINICILAHLIGTDDLPDLSQHVVMLEEVGEYAYRTDRDMAQIVRSQALQDIWGFMGGRISQIPANDPEFELDEFDLVRHWAEAIYIGPADIGHDAQNKVVPYGKLA